MEKGDYVERGWPKLPYVSYIASKIAVSAMSCIQQRDFDKDPREDMIVNHVHPGYVITRMVSFQGFLTTEQGKQS